ncbi:hypothetical protein WKI71_10990 [Streptomyces sp. MS1.AVA.1]|uniref:Uncharacterized protein n=1 Tax=Streptomyces machairae TaxID=3134109 RepID=A0ABU8UIT2_9ACTN
MADLAVADEVGVPELAAEAVLLQALLDWFQARPGGRGPDGGGKG